MVYFLVKSLFDELKEPIKKKKRSLFDKLKDGGVAPFPERMIWNPCVPTKAVFFTWEAWWGPWGNVMTLDQLKRRGFIIANRCFLCGEDEGSIFLFTALWLGSCDLLFFLC